MDLYLSSPSPTALNLVQERSPESKLDILLTSARMPSDVAAYMTKFDGITRKWALDSGAFSENNSKLNISRRELFSRHVNYAKEYGDKFDVIFNFDVDFEPDGFHTNNAYLQELKENGINAVPVIHNLKNHEIDTFIEGGYDYVAIGQQEDKAKPDTLFPGVFKLHSHGVKTHLFGITDFGLIAGCPATSCDSKSWLDDALTGVVRFWNPEKPGENKTDVIYFPNELGKRKTGTFLCTEYSHIDQFKRFIGKYGLTIDDLRGLNGNVNKEFLGIIYYETVAKVVTAIHATTPLFL